MNQNEIAVKSQCIICNSNLKRDNIESTEGFSNFSCPRCGNYQIHNTIVDEVTKLIFAQEDMAMLGGYFSNQSNIVRTIEEINQIIEQVPPGPVERSNIILEYLKNLSTFIGKDVRPDNLRLQGLSYSKNSKEIEYLISRYLVGLKYVSEDGPSFVIEPKGWEHLATLQSRKNKTNSVFCAMWFDPSMNSYFQKINEIILDCGYELIRVDKVAHNNKICDEIIVKIKQSKFVIADFTNHRGGVYFEAGFAMGERIPVIFTCQKNDLANLHFDIRQYNTITWENDKLDELEYNLSNRIRATIS
jgi:predicted RNA-binding Zn-ribbon protein involved in translation (DUF1610 family)